MRAHLIACLGRAGFGEPAVGLLLAKQLLAAGDTVEILTDPALAKLFEGAPCPVHVLPETGPIEPVFQRAARCRPASIVLADYVVAMEGLLRRGVSPGFLHTLGARLVLIDTWHASEIGNRLEAGLNDTFVYDPGFASYPWRLVPVPFVRPGAPGAFSILPSSAPIDPSLREGLPADARVLFLATSLWNHEGSEAVAPLRQSLPPVLAHLLGGLDTRVHLVHVGPAALAAVKATLGERYHHRTALPAPAFRSLLASADAVLSLNTAATSNTVAVASGVPVVVLHNPTPGDAEEVAAVHGPLEPVVTKWIAGLGRLPRFAMWPYSLWDALDPLLTDNPYGALLHRTPIVDLRVARERLQALLFDPAARATNAKAASAYRSSLAALPSGADRIRAFINA